MAIGVRSQINNQHNQLYRLDLTFNIGVLSGLSMYPLSPQNVIGMNQKSIHDVFSITFTLLFGEQTLSRERDYFLRERLADSCPLLMFTYAACKIQSHVANYFFGFDILNVRIQRDGN
ncbi:hypothetical protein Dimus_009547 [Dionaea muscipula]